MGPTLRYLLVLYLEPSTSSIIMIVKHSTCKQAMHSLRCPCPLYVHFRLQLTHLRPRQHRPACLPPSLLFKPKARPQWIAKALCPMRTVQKRPQAPMMTAAWIQAVTVMQVTQHTTGNGVSRSRLLSCYLFSTTFSKVERVHTLKALAMPHV